MTGYVNGGGVPQSKPGDEKLHSNIDVPGIVVILSLYHNLSLVVVIEENDI